MTQQVFNQYVTQDLPFAALTKPTNESMICMITYRLMQIYKLIDMSYVERRAINDFYIIQEDGIALNQKRLALLNANLFLFHNQ